MNVWLKASERSRTRALAVVRGLLHDWIKYMEMRLFSVDWSSPPDHLGALLGRALLQTRRHEGETRGARAIWCEGRARLLALDSAGSRQLVSGLDSDLTALEALLEAIETGGRPLEGAAALVRRPGQRLRAARDELVAAGGGMTNPDEDEPT